MVVGTQTPIPITQVNRWEVVGIQVWLNNTPTFTSHVRRGYDDGNGVVWLNEEPIPVALSGEALVTLWEQAPQGTTLFESVITAVHAYLISIGMIPVTIEVV